ncbi:hypothetical protein ACFOLG_17025 [Vogesella facilis]|uniref:Uncharacterized protein n=1 Tax=Vogesella facilis TaxID=1655232 RepID=A0ABV7RKP3_9NEIS
MEIRSSTSAIPYPTPATSQPRPAANGDDSQPAASESPSTIVTLQQRPDAANPGATDAAGGTADGANDGTTPSPIKSFTYGALGLPEPLAPEELPVKPENTYFTAGKWVAAAATVGSIVSLLV